MKTLQDCKNEVASNNGCEDWDHLQVSAQDDLEHEKLYDEAALLFASELAKEVLKRAAERAEVVHHPDDERCDPIVYPPSILNTEYQDLLK